VRQNCPHRANRLLSNKIKFAEVDLRKDWFEAALRRALVHRCKVARSVVHRFRLTRTYPVGVHTLLDMDPRTLGQPTIPANVPANVPGNVIVAISDSELLDHVLSITAVVGVEPLVLGDVGLLRQHWASASMILLGVDQGSRVSTMGLARRTEVYIVAEERNANQAQHWSMQLGAAVVTVPASASWLSDALANVAVVGRRGTGRLVCVLGGSGGVGASTLAAALAFVAARTQRTMIIDADHLSGGLDLLLGAERTPGWRWPRLATARGHLGNLTGQLPSVDGIDVLSMARGEAPPGWAPQAEQLKAVMLSAMRSYDITVVDLSRTLSVAAWEALRRADLAILVVRDDIRGIAAGREVVRDLEGECERLGLVVRHGRSHLLEPKLVAGSIGLPLLGSLAEDPTLVLAAERGDPPGRSARSSLSRLCRQLIDALPLEDPARQKALVSS
jgi:secretion/DNA translocation related CpaE-like protein